MQIRFPLFCLTRFRQATHQETPKRAIKTHKINSLSNFNLQQNILTLEIAIIPRPLGPKPSSILADKSALLSFVQFTHKITQTNQQTNDYQNTKSIKQTNRQKQQMIKKKKQREYSDIGEGYGDRLNSGRMSETHRRRS